MKINKYFLSLASATLLLASCGTDDLDLGNSTTAPVAANCPGVEFAVTTETNVEVDPSDTKFDLTIVRQDSVAAEYNIKVLENEDNTFGVPSKVSFAQGEKEKDITITMKEGAAAGVPIALSLTFDDNVKNPYTDGYKTLELTSTIIKWEHMGKAYWKDGVLAAAFELDPTVMYVDVDTAVTATSKKYRFMSPYGKVASDEDELGATDGFTSNEEGDLTGNAGYIVISVTEDGAEMAISTIGIDYGYGEMQIATIYGNLSSNISSYPLGTFTKSSTGGKIVFPGNSLFLSLPSYGNLPAGLESALYLSADDYKASLTEEE